MVLVYIFYLRYIFVKLLITSDSSKGFRMNVGPIKHRFGPAENGSKIKSVHHFVENKKWQTVHVKQVLQSINANTATIMIWSTGFVLFNPWCVPILCLTLEKESKILVRKSRADRIRIPSNNRNRDLQFAGIIKVEIMIAKIYFCRMGYRTIIGIFINHFYKNTKNNFEFLIFKYKKNFVFLQNIIFTFPFFTLIKWSELKTLFSHPQKMQKCQKCALLSWKMNRKNSNRKKNALCIQIHFHNIF